MDERKRAAGLALSMVTAVLALAGCGGGSGDSPAPAGTKMIFSVDNGTAADFSRVSIQDRNSAAVVYEGSFSCPSRAADCRILYSGPDIIGTAVLSFKNAQGQIVAFYDTAGVPGAFVPATVSDWTTGAYLFEELINAASGLAQLSGPEMDYRLRQFFSEYPGNNADTFYEQIAAYYRNSPAATPGNVANFTGELAKRLLDNEAAATDQFQTANARLALAGSTGGCPPGVTNFISFAADVAGDYFGGLYKPLMKQIGALGTDACKPAADNSKLNNIVSQLNNLQNSMDNLQSSVGKLSNFVAKAKLEEKLKQFDSTLKDVASLSSRYEYLRTSNAVDSVHAYVVSRYGNGPGALDQALADDAVGGVLTAIVQAAGVGRADGSLLKSIDNLTASDLTFVEGLNLLCRKPDVGDLIQARNLCNEVIQSSVSRLVASHRMASTLLAEGYALLDAYPVVARKYGYDTSKGAARYNEELRTTFAQQADGLVNSFRAGIVNLNNTNGYFHLFEGLPAALLANLKNVRCYDDYNRQMLITGWVLDSRDEYLITNCLVAQTAFTSHSVQARYFLKVNGADVKMRDDVVNVLGVLIPADFFANYDGWPNRNQWAGSYADVRKIAFKHTISPLPGRFAVNTQNIGSLGTVKVLDPNTSSVDPMALAPSLYPWSNATLRAQGLTLFTQAAGALTSTWTNWLRFTDDKGFSYAFILQGRGGGGTTLQCVTHDCTASTVHGSSTPVRNEPTEASGEASNALNFRSGLQKLTLGFSEPGDRPVYGWQIDTQFIDAR